MSVVNLNQDFWTVRFGVHVYVLHPVMEYVNAAAADRINVVRVASVLVSGIVAVGLCLGKMTDLPVETPTD